MIDYTCSSCQTKVEVDEASAGDNVRCPGCGQVTRARVDSAEAITIPPTAPGSSQQTTSPPGIVAPGREGALPVVRGYEVLGTLGRGAMGVVYQARQIGLDRLVALKMILTGSQAGESERRRFATEAQAVARLRHPNIVTVHEIGEHDGLPYVTLEYCNGGSLAALAERHLRLPPAIPTLPTWSESSPRRCKLPTTPASSTATSNRPTC